ncbi:MAG TPA: hypothetical protein VGK09_05485 [Rhodocyclaceae bacterium]|jgi:4-amino-4-deoxy-L-arabinose transferase-like glycosyltransferase
MPIALPLSPRPLIVFCTLYLLAGLVGHDPWKVDDAVHLGVAYEFAKEGDWLNPRIANDAWLGMPPLFHWLAALLGKGLSPLLAFHNAARLATALCGALLFYGLSRTAQRLHGPTAALGAPLLAMGTVGLLVPIHEAQPLIALLAAQSFLHLGLARLIAGSRKDLFLGSLIASLSIALGLLSVGALAIIPLAVLPLLALLHPAWRGKNTAAVLLALLFGLGLASLWPLTLANTTPELLPTFWKIELAKLTPPTWSADTLQNHMELLGWAPWPLLPIALWALWAYRRQLTTPAFFLPLVGTLLAFVQIFLLAEPRPLNHLLLIVPLVLLASAGVEKLRRGAANAFDWFGMMTFTLLAGLVWLGGWSMMTGEPARVAKNFTKSEPGFVGELSLPALIAALLLSGIWLWSLFRLPKSPWRSATHWAAGLTLMWGLLATLWMPWMDYGKTYRPVALSLRKALAGNDGCVTARNLGDAQKASLRYFMDLAPRAYSSKHQECDLLLIQGSPRSENTQPGWRKVWEGNRAGDKGEKLRLYRRND